MTAIGPATDPQPVVLAVDDAPDTLSLLTDIIEGARMTALVARGGTAALALMARVRPDLILMDALMPDLDGFETCRRLKAQDALSHIPVVFMTGLSDSESVVRGFAAGGVDFVPKPIVASELAARIRVHLANARMAHSARIALDMAGPPLAAADARGRIVWMTPQAADMLAGALARTGQTSDYEAPDCEAPDRHAPDWRAPDWRAAAAPALAAAIARGAGHAPLLSHGESRLDAAFIGAGAPGEFLFRMTDSDAPGDGERLRRALGLTARESEVLLWIAQGKSNRDVAAILDCSPRTVNKHLETIYGKLAVDNRTAAAMTAVRCLTGAGQADRRDGA